MRLQQGPPSPEAMQSPNCKCKECSSSAAASIVLVPVQRPSAASQTPTAIMRTDAISNTIIIQCERAHLYPSTCPALGSALLRAQEVKDAYPCPNPPLQCTVALLKQVRRVWATSVLKGCLTARVSLPLRLEQRIRWAPFRPRYQGVRVSTGPGRMERHSTVPVRSTRYEGTVHLPVCAYKVVT
jgi:hypothetical protein